MQVFVLLFNVGTDNEGLHTLQLNGQDWVLMFEDEDDATRYALLLEAQDFPTPAVEAIAQEEIEEFCTGAGFEYRLIPKGFVPESDLERLLLVPPEKNVAETDWARDQKSTPSLDAPPTAPPPEAEDEPVMSDSELEQMRRRLEGLL